jgi:hypothetical protein
LRNLPIPLVTKSQQKPIITLVAQIISAKRENSAKDTVDMEQKIDRLVYGLYGLTENEIVAVDSY